jgi:hypothetical protein
MAFRKSIKLNLDKRQVLQQLRHFSTMPMALVPDKSLEPPIDRPLADSSLTRLSNVIPELKGARADRYWAGLVDLTPAVCRSSMEEPPLGPDRHHGSVRPRIRSGSCPPRNRS